jgi:hypothetical protein
MHRDFAQRKKALFFDLSVGDIFDEGIADIFPKAVGQGCECIQGGLFQSSKQPVYSS